MSRRPLREPRSGSAPWGRSNVRRRESRREKLSLSNRVFLLNIYNFQKMNFIKLHVICSSLVTFLGDAIPLGNFAIMFF